MPIRFWQIVEGKARWLNQLMSGTAARPPKLGTSALLLLTIACKSCRSWRFRVLEKDQA